MDTGAVLVLWRVENHCVRARVLARRYSAEKLWCDLRRIPIRRPYDIHILVDVGRPLPARPTL